MIFRGIAFIGLLLLCSTARVAAFELVPTQCRFTKPYNGNPVEVSFGPALVQLAQMSDAKMRGDQRRLKTAAWEVARLIAGYPAGHQTNAMLDVVRRLDLGGLDQEAVEPVFRRFLEILDPIALQTSETSSGHLSLYLTADDYVFGTAGNNRYQRLKDLQKNASGMALNVSHGDFSSCYASPRRSANSTAKRSSDRNWKFFGKRRLH